MYLIYDSMYPNTATGKWYTYNIWSLLWFSRKLMICSEQTDIDINTVPRTFSSLMAKTQELIFFRSATNFMSRTTTKAFTQCSIFQTN